MRKTFGQFITEVKKPVKTGNTPEEDAIEKYGKPAIIQQGGHSKNKKPAFDTEKYGTPVLIQHGGHSVNKNSLREAFMPYRRMDHPNPNVWGTYKPTGTGFQVGAERLERQRLKRIDPMTTNSLYDMFRDENQNWLPNSHWGEELHNQQDALELHYHYDTTPYRVSLRKYTDDSSALNRELFNRHLNGEPHEYDTQDSVSEHYPGRLDIALSHHRLPQPLTVFSGLKFDPATQLSDSGRLFLPSYTSTSIDPNVAKNFAQHILRTSRSNVSGSSFANDPNLDYAPEADAHILQIELPKGHGGMYLGRRSNYDSEKEFLMPRRTVLQVSKTPIISKDYKDVSYSGLNDGKTVRRRLHIWQARPVQVD